MKKNILICGYPNTVLRIFIETIKDDYTVYFLSYSRKGQYTEIKKNLGDKIFLIDTESGTTLKKMYNFLRFFCLAFRIASDKRTRSFVAYHNHFIKNGLLMVLIKICFPHITRIHFPYDIHVYQFPKELKYHYDIEKEKLRIKVKLHGWLSLFFDKICFENAHKIITKGFENELDYLKTVYKIQGKTHFVFNYLIEKKDLVEKKINNLKGDITHLVFIGGMSNAPSGDNNYKVFAELLKEKNIVLHVYSHSSEVLQPLTYHKNLQIHKYITNHKELINDISQYDFGISLSIPPHHDYLQAKMASGVKIYDYLTAGLPIIIDTEHVEMANIITTNNFGVVIPLNKIGNIKTYINKCDYELLLMSVKKNREKFIIENQKANVIRFLQQEP